MTCLRQLLRMHNDVFEFTGNRVGSAQEIAAEHKSLTIGYS